MLRPVFWACGVGVLLVWQAGFAAEPKPSAPVSYYRQVRPIFQERCQGCHQPAKRDGGFDITNLPAMRKGGDSDDPGMVPGAPLSGERYKVCLPFLKALGRSEPVTDRETAYASKASKVK